MALFMPTYVTPSLTGELGNGVVDATQDLTVSWMVNGNSPMTSFSITIYQNNAASTQLYTTGQITTGCPFYGKNAQGVSQLFSYTIAASALSGAGITNGGEYKLVIQQWWSSTESVTQSSASAFITRAAPVLTMSSIGTVNAKNATFTATYSQAQGDALNWVRWQIAYADNTANPFYDSQNLYGVSELSVSYDGFFDGASYAVQCSVQTSNGVEATTGWVTFPVSYSVQAITDTAIACTAAPPCSAVLLNWSNISYIYGQGSGDYSISAGNILNMGAGSTIIWDEENGSQLSLSAPWSLLYNGALSEGSGTLLTATCASGQIVVSYLNASRTFSLSIGGTSYTVTGVHPDAAFSVIVTPTTQYVRIDQLTGGLYPSSTLYPGTTLYPSADTIPQTLQQTFSPSYTQSAITEVKLTGPQTCKYVQILAGTASAEIISAVYTAGNYTPSPTSGTVFLTDFSQGLNAGTSSLGGAEITGWTVYRQKQGENLLTQIADVDVDVTKIYDYGAGSQQGNYIYYIYPHNSNAYLSNPMVSSPINPVFWTWTILVCDPSGTTTYTVTQEFSFGKNLQSGSISNNNSPGIFSNFTAYPTVQLSPQNYQGGTLQSLIGVIGFNEAGQWSYSDSISLRDAIYKLSTTTNPLFLKNRKGDVFPIRISGAITMTTEDATAQQMLTASIPWVQTGPATGFSLVAQAAAPSVAALEG